MTVLYLINFMLIILITCFSKDKIYKKTLKFFELNNHMTFEEKKENIIDYLPLYLLHIFVIICIPIIGAIYYIIVLYGDIILNKFLQLLIKKEENE